MSDQIIAVIPQPATAICVINLTCRSLILWALAANGPWNRSLPAEKKKSTFRFRNPNKRTKNDAQGIGFAKMIL